MSSGLHMVDFSNERTISMRWNENEDRISIGVGDGEETHLHYDQARQLRLMLNTLFSNMYDR